MQKRRSLRRSRHLHLRRSFSLTTGFACHLYHDSTFSPPSSTITHLRSFQLDKPEIDFTSVTSASTTIQEAMLRFNLAKRATTSANSTLTSTLKTMTIQVADKEQGVVLGTTKTKKQNKLKLY
ncbi:hypothetical protein Bca52824_032882, partial [Brassica carinata]